MERKERWEKPPDSKDQELDEGESSGSGVEPSILGDLFQGGGRARHCWQR